MIANNPNFIEKCWAFVALMKMNVLIVNLCGYERAFVAENFRPKSRDVFMNEIEGAQDVTVLISNISFNIADESQMSMQSRLDNIPKMDFKFGHDNFIQLQRIEKNIY